MQRKESDPFMNGTNENCLEGMACPHCGSEGPFEIAGKSWFKVYDDGTDEFSDVEWDEDSACVCCSCNQQGLVKDFRLET
jgi:hypothetical protein